MYGWERFGALVYPRRVRDAPLVGEPGRFVDHATVGVEPHDCLEASREFQRDDAGPAPHIEQTAVPVESELTGHRLGQPRRIR